MSKVKEKQEDKDFLFKTKTVITEEEFNKYQKFYLNKFNNSLIYKIILVVLALIILIINIVRGNTYFVILLCILIILYPLGLHLTINIQIKNMYKSNIKINMLEEEITFYDDYLTSRSKRNYCKVNYKDIYRVCETKNNFYIFINKNQSFIIVKNNVNDLEKFSDFIRNISDYKKY